MTRSQAQKRAQHALEKINEVATSDENRQQHYRSYVESLPATIIMNGLGQALAMEKAGAAKKGDIGFGHRAVYEHLNDWLTTRWQEMFGGDKPDDILHAIVKGDEEKYLLMQSEAMAYLEWLKKFAAASLKKPDGNENDG